METVGSAHTGVALANLFTPVRSAMKNKDSSAILFVKKAIKELVQIASRLVLQVGVTMDFFATNLMLTVAFHTAPRASVFKMLQSVKRMVLLGFQLANRDSPRLVVAYVPLNVQRV